MTEKGVVENIYGIGSGYALSTDSKMISAEVLNNRIKK